MKNFKSGSGRGEFGGRGGFGGRDRGDRGDRGGRGGFGGRDRGGRGGFGDEPVRTMHRATCAECGKSCEVPFRPTGEKPVYCSTCFGSRQDSPMEHRSERRTERFDRPTPAAKPEHNHRLEEKMTEMSAKLDRLIELLASASNEPEKVAVKKTAPVKPVVVKSVAVKSSAVKSAPKKAVKKATKKK